MLHVLALIVVAVWGTTFVSTKVLLNAGLEPAQIFFLRFVLAYAGIWLVGKAPVWAGNVKDELRMAALGVTGGSMYFLTENIALQYTQASNVALLVCTAPVLTGLVLHLSNNERLDRRTVLGWILAFAGVGLVVFNGNFILQLNPVGDTLSIAAAASWACYTLIIKGLSKEYSALLITRKVFFYGLLTILPFLSWRDMPGREMLSQPVVWGNLLFLGIVASLACFVAWNIVVKRLGAIKTTNYVYFQPAITLVTASIVLDERITAIALGGAAFIFLGLLISNGQRRTSRNN